ncbi:chaplin [Streptomyces sp. JJ36]|uniref:chaplin n=1 Tax=Streptomyces sp. JJ36 TaxID=2736645 RepID=UPI001F321F4C|nr:chaplin [Streptomyces sp. JJ36]MCF6522008.1 chaplin [Streptomyces sp. JJ36]
MRISTSLAAAGLAATAVLAGGSAAAAAGPDPVGVAAKSPGVLSGNVVQVPVRVPVNVCGNTVNIVGLLNPAVANVCVIK